VNVETLKDDLRGVIIAAITPMNQDYSIDLGGLKANLAQAVEDGIVKGKGGFIIGGGGGEMAMLTVEERVAIVKAAVEVVDGRATIQAGIQDNGTIISIELAKRFQDVGADAIQVGQPYFFKHTDDDLIRYFEDLDRALDIGIVIYNTWWRARNINSHLLERLAQIPKIIACKWSTLEYPDLKRGYTVLADKINLIDNQGFMLMTHHMGAKGFISGSGDFWPQYDLQVWEHLENGRYREAAEMLARLATPLYDFRIRIAQRTGGEASVKKAAAELVGRAGGPPREPCRPLSTEERAELRRIFEEAEVPNLR